MCEFFAPIVTDGNTRIYQLLVEIFRRPTIDATMPLRVQTCVLASSSHRMSCIQTLQLPGLSDSGTPLARVRCELLHVDRDNQLRPLPPGLAAHLGARTQVAITRPTTADDS